MRCKSCGATMPEDVRYCRTCGEMLISREDPATLEDRPIGVLVLIGALLLGVLLATGIYFWNEWTVRHRFENSYLDYYYNVVEMWETAVSDVSFDVETKWDGDVLVVVRGESGFAGKVYLDEGAIRPFRAVYRYEEEYRPVLNYRFVLQGLEIDGEEQSVEAMDEFLDYIRYRGMR
ncbi:MAG: hypothetical protein Q4A52_08225 [Bacillota bacterium]|nr:hypothetical protein [Bacillota bacterium]